MNLVKLIFNQNQESWNQGKILKLCDDFFQFAPIARNYSHYNPREMVPKFNSY